MQACPRVLACRRSVTLLPGVFRAALTSHVAASFFASSTPWKRTLLNLFFPSRYVGGTHRPVWLAKSYCGVLPRALLAEMKLSRMLLGSSGGEQFLLVLTDDSIEAANEFLTRAAQAISALITRRVATSLGQHGKPRRMADCTASVWTRILRAKQPLRSLRVSCGSFRTVCSRESRDRGQLLCRFRHSASFCHPHWLDSR